MEPQDLEVRVRVESLVVVRNRHVLQEGQGDQNDLEEDPDQEGICQAEDQSLGIPAWVRLAASGLLASDLLASSLLELGLITLDLN
jgi:hypothetical protein